MVVSRQTMSVSCVGVVLVGEVRCQCSCPALFQPVCLHVSLCIACELTACS